MNRTMIFLEGIRLDTVVTGMTWIHTLRFAMLCGWSPAGTTSRFTNWTGTYERPAGQAVTQEDAVDFAQALQRGLPDLDDENILDLYTEGVDPTYDEPVYSLPTDVLLSVVPSDYLAGHRRHDVERIIDLALDGPFYIRAA